MGHENGRMVGNLRPLARIQKKSNCEFGFKSSWSCVIKSALLHAHCAGCITRLFEALLSSPNFGLALGVRRMFPSCQIYLLLSIKQEEKGKSKHDFYNTVVWFKSTTYPITRIFI